VQVGDESSARLAQQLNVRQAEGIDDLLDAGDRACRAREGKLLVVVAREMSLDVNGLDGVAVRASTRTLGFRARIMRATSA
jgi:hypothetical protein